MISFGFSEPPTDANLIFKSSSTSLHICRPSRNLWIRASYPAWQLNSDPCIKTRHAHTHAKKPSINTEMAQQVLHHVLESILNSLCGKRKCRSSTKQKIVSMWPTASGAECQIRQKLKSASSTH